MKLSLSKISLLFSRFSISSYNDSDDCKIYISIVGNSDNIINCCENNQCDTKGRIVTLNL